MVNLDYLYNPAAAKKILGIDCFVDKKLGFQVIENGMILPHKDVMVNGKWTRGSGGLVDSKGAFIKASATKSDVGKAYTPPQNQFNTALKQSFISDYFIMLGDTL